MTKCRKQWIPQMWRSVALWHRGGFADNRETKLFSLKA
jgi:hypothetical protein